MLYVSGIWCNILWTLCGSGPVIYPISVLFLVIHCCLHVARWLQYVQPSMQREGLRQKFHYMFPTYRTTCLYWTITVRRERHALANREKEAKFFSMSMFYTWQVQRNLRLTSINRACDKITLWCTLLPFYTHQNWHRWCLRQSSWKLFVQDWESKSVTAAPGPLWW